MDRGEGYFEPRRVELGWRSDDRVEVVRGLSLGERVVVAGTFLLDSESRMRAAEMGITQPEVDPVCGMEVDRATAKAAGRITTRGGETRYFCSEMCRKQFDANPDKYLPRSPVATPPPVRPPSPAGASARRAFSRAARPMSLPNPVRDQVADRIRAADHGLNTTAAEAHGRTAFALDPVCGAEVDTSGATARSTYNGTTYYFLSDACKAAFDKEPDKYVVK